MNVAVENRTEALHDRVFRRLIEQVREERRETGAQEYAIDAARYVSPDRYAAERERIFLANPIPVARSSQLAAPGDTLTFDALGVPALLIRNERGEIGAFLNMCRHRATRLVPGSDEPCRMKALTCPYHGWTYGIDGALRGMPLADGFDRLERAQRGLIPLPVAERHGFIWLACNRHASFDIDDFLGDIAEGMRAFNIETDYQFRQSRRLIRANWKSTIDAFLETYHVARLHKDTLAKYFADTMMASEPVGPHICASIGRPSIDEVAKLPAAKWKHRQHSIFLYYVYPNSIFVFLQDFAHHLAMYPQGPEETLVVDTMLVPHAPRDRKQNRFWLGKFQEIDEGAFYEEDFAMCERAQEGVRAMPDGEIAIGRYEPCLKTFHDTLDKALSG